MRTFDVVDAPDGFWMSNFISIAKIVFLVVLTSHGRPKDEYAY